MTENNNFLEEPFNQRTIDDFDDPFLQNVIGDFPALSNTPTPFNPHNFDINNFSANTNYVGSPHFGSDLAHNLSSFPNNDITSPSFLHTDLSNSYLYQHEDPPNSHFNPSPHLLDQYQHHPHIINNNNPHPAPSICPNPPHTLDLAMGYPLASPDPTSSPTSALDPPDPSVTLSLPSSFSPSAATSTHPHSHNMHGIHTSALRSASGNAHGGAHPHSASNNNPHHQNHQSIISHPHHGLNSHSHHARGSPVLNSHAHKGTASPPSSPSATSSGPSTPLTSNSTQFDEFFQSWKQLFGPLKLPEKPLTQFSISPQTKSDMDRASSCLPHLQMTAKGVQIPEAEDAQIQAAVAVGFTNDRVSRSIGETRGMWWTRPSRGTKPSLVIWEVHRKSGVVEFYKQISLASAKKNSKKFN